MSTATTADSFVNIGLAVSEFDRFEGKPGASEAERFYLRPPPGAKELLIFGDRNLAMAVHVEEPYVRVNPQHAPYMGLGGLEHRFLHAPPQSARFARIEPLNRGDLEANGRSLTFVGQVRLAPSKAAGKSLGERPLDPVGHPPRRQLWVKRTLADDDSRKPDQSARYWYRVQEGQRVLVKSRRGRIPRLRVRYEVARSMLGREFDFSLDDDSVHEGTLIVPSEEFAVEIPEGWHRLGYQGLGTEAVVFADARPAGTTHGYIVRSVFELTTTRWLEFPIDRKEGKPLRVALFVVTEEAAASWTLTYAVRGNRRKRPSLAPFRQVSDREGQVMGVSGDHELGTLWESSHALSDELSLAGSGVSKAVLHLGDDLSSRYVRLRLRIPRTASASKRLWVRAVLIGQHAPSASSASRRWLSASKRDDV
ncbi:MAG: hypothetical protein OEZ06_16345 [Myxococcales bacterium]|nr:hypothetical protein [Myxococcales bacterium]